VQDLFLLENRAAQVGAATVARCRLAIPGSSAKTQDRQLLRLFTFASLSLQIDDTFFSESETLSVGKSCVMSFVRLQTMIATATSVNRALDAIGGTQRDPWKQE
jgi:hypothetical protein